MSVTHLRGTSWKTFSSFKVKYLKIVTVVVTYEKHPKKKGSSFCLFVLKVVEGLFIRVPE